METRCLVIGGTFAPWLCERPYYGNVLAIPEGFNLVTEFTSIELLGLGDIKDAVACIAKKCIETNTDNIILIGHSQGSIIASLLAMQYPDRIVTVIALAGPYGGTIWTDPQTMVVKLGIEGIKQLSGGLIVLKPRLSKSRLSSLAGRFIPIVRDLASDSEVLRTIKRYLDGQYSGPYTHSIIGTDDMFVLPSRSAHPSGPKVKKYLAAHPDIHHHLHGIIPEEIVLLAFKAGHIGMVHDPGVLGLISKIIEDELSLRNPS